MFKIGRLVFFKNKQYTIHSVKLQESYPISLDNYLTFTLKGFRYNDEGNFGSDYERIYLCNVLKTRFNKLKYLNLGYRVKGDYLIKKKVNKNENEI